MLLIRFFLAAVLAATLNAQVMRRAPGFSLVDSSQKFHDLADYRGKVVLLDLMKTGCPHCEEMSRTLEQMKTKFGTQVQVLSIVTMPDNPKTVAEYVNMNKVTSPVLFDCGQVMGSYLRPTSPQVTLPQLFVIDKNGYIRQVFQTTAAPDVLARAVDAALK